MPNLTTPIKFGTDGWRAIMDKEFTFENVELVAQAFSDYLNGEFQKKNVSRKPKVAIGYDTRRNSSRYAETFAGVLVGNGIQVLLTDRVCPTPAVSYAVVREKCDAGIAVTASHNPPDYNGIKLKTDFGGSADKNVTNAVEALIGRGKVVKNAFAPANPVVTDLCAAYLDHMKSYLDIERIKQAPYRVLVDSMHGAGDGHIEALLAGGRIRVTTIRGARDVTFGGSSPEPIPHNLAASIALMEKGEYDLGVVTDGDADRIGAIRPGGEFVSPGTILSLILLHFVEDQKRTGSVVTTISNTALIYKVARRLDLKIHETPVGFKYICEIMRRENVLIGGEESGGIGFQNYLYERDGMLSALLLMEMMAVRRQSFEEILSGVEKEFGKLYYVREDLKYPNELKPRLFQYLSVHRSKEILGRPVKDVRDTDGVKYILKDDSWLLFRLSGTEPILRIYSEATSQALAQDLVNHGKDIAFHLPG